MRKLVPVLVPTSRIEASFERPRPPISRPNSWRRPTNHQCVSSTSASTAYAARSIGYSSNNPRPPIGIEGLFYLVGAATSTLHCRLFAAMGSRTRPDRRPRHLVDPNEPDILEPSLRHHSRHFLPRPIMGDARQHLVKDDGS